MYVFIFNIILRKHNWMCKLKVRATITTVGILSKNLITIEYDFTRLSVNFVNIHVGLAQT